MRTSDVAWLVAAAALTAAFAPLPAQGDRGGEITGTVVDSARGPLADADVFLRGTGRRARTDSAGQYRFAGVRSGSYSVIARKIGYRYEEAELFVRESGSTKQDFVLTRRVVLEAVEVTARGECVLESIEGFFCRQRRQAGAFLDYPDIDILGHTYTGELFRHLKGWRVTMRRAADGSLLPVPARAAAYCVMYLVDGRVVRGWSDVPLYTGDLTAMEVYIRPDTVPSEVRREMTFHSAPGRGTNARSCDAVVFWTRRAAR